MTLKTIKIVEREALYVRAKDIPSSVRPKLIEDFTYRFYDEKACDGCEFRPERHSDVCDNCASYKGGAQLAQSIEQGGKRYMKFPVGNKIGMIRQLREHDVIGPRTRIEYVDRQTDVESAPMRRPLKFRYKRLRPDQVEAVKALLGGYKGVLKAPPRTGKCIVGSSLVMTEEGLSPIRDLFVPYALNKSSETVIKSSLDISTVNGTRATSHLYTKVVDTTFKVFTAAGYDVRGTANHKVRVLDEDLKLKWMRLDEVKANHHLVISRKSQWLGKGSALLSDRRDYRNSGDGFPIVDLPTELSPELSRIMGYLVANGALSVRGRLGITSNNVKVLKDFVHCMAVAFPDVATRLIKPRSGECKHDKRTGSVYCHSLQARAFLEDACGLASGTARQKSIPSVLFKADRKYILEFLGAYTTCDAWIHGIGLEYCSASKKLIDELHVVLTYLGIVGTKSRTTNSASNGSGIVRPYYKIQLHGKDTNKLLDLFTIRKSHTFKGATWVNQHDVVPHARTFLRTINAKYSSGHCNWAKGKKIYSKKAKGSLLHNNGKGFAKGGPYYREHVQNINLDTLGWLEPKALETLKAAYNEDLYYSPVTEVRQINKPVRVYDVAVPDGRQFVANGVVNHNTVMKTALVCKLGGKALILASQEDWLQGFYETFCGSSTQFAWTNATGSGAESKERAAWRKAGRPHRSVGFCKTYEDFEKHDVCLVTYQTFLSPKGRKLLHRVRNMFAVLGVDEVHGGGAAEYAIVISKINSKYKIGLSGTPSRKDGRYILVRNLMGPNLYESKVKVLTPKVQLTETGFKHTAKGRAAMWANLVTKLDCDPKRLKLIAETAIKDVKDGHMVLIPMHRVKAIKALVMAINRLAGSKIAAEFHGGTAKDTRKNTILAARKYEVKILVGQFKLLSTGINIPRASAIYEVSMSANKENAEQRINRVLTVYDDKPPPLLRVFLDDMDVRRACLRKEWWTLIHPTFKPIMDDNTQLKLKNYFSQKTKNSSSDGTIDF